MNVIGKASLEVSRGATEHALVFQQEVAAWAKERLLPAVEQMLDELPVTKDVIVVDRLDVTLELTDSGDWKSRATDRLCSELKELVLQTMAGVAQVETRRVPAAVRFYDKLVFFLHHGVFPWSLPVKDDSEFAQETQRWLQAPDSVPLYARLRKELRHPTASRRFLGALTDESLHATLDVLYGLPTRHWAKWKRDIDVVIESLEAPSYGSTPQDDVLQHWGNFQIELGAQLAAGRQGPDVETSVAESCLARITQGKRVLRARLVDLPFTSSAFRQAVQHLVNRTETDVVQTQTQTRTGVSTDEGSETKSALSESTREHELAREGIYIHNAGLILLAPYLRMFLSQLELVRGDQMLEPEKAVAALDHLATGDRRFPEFRLVLPKVLCGWDLKSPLPSPLALTAKAPEESQALLASVIDHWSVLQNTSVTGLREAFLQRPGKLTLTPRDDWLLQVEQKAYDMLIQHLPWSYSLIRLPWMKRLLRTEWVE